MYRLNIAIFLPTSNNNNGWLAADDYLLGELVAMVNEQMVMPAVEEVTEAVVEAEEEQVIALVVDMVEGQMDAPMMDMEEDLAVLFGDDDFEDDASNGFGEEEVWEVNEDWLMAPTIPPPVLAVPPPSVYEVGGPSTAVAKGPSFPQVAPRLPVPPSVIKGMSTRLDNLEYGHEHLVQRVIQGSDAEIAGRVGSADFYPEGRDRYMIDSASLGLAGRCAAKRHADPTAADYCYRDEQQGEHADAVHFGIRETDCSLREKTTMTHVKNGDGYEDVSRPSIVGGWKLRWLVTRLKVRNGEDFSYRRRMLPLTYQPMAMKKTSFPEMECGGSIDISIPDAVKDQGEALGDA
ncbi:hypothetical protein Tco_1224443 [Tanacetum coccineum]